MMSIRTTLLKEATMIEAELLEELKKNMGGILPVPGLKADFSFARKGGPWEPDVALEISFNGKRIKAAGELVSSRSLAAFRSELRNLISYAESKGSALPLLISDFLSEEKRKECKAARVNFLDLSGNVYLAGKGLYIERDGFPDKHPQKRIGRGPFSDKASLILRISLQDKNRLWGVREMAQAANLDPGFVSRMMNELVERGYWVKENRKFKLLDAKSLLEDWVREYDYRKSERHDYFCLAGSPDEILRRLQKAGDRKSANYALSFQAGASLLAPHAIYNEVHVYAKDAIARSFLVEQLKLEQVERGANVIILHPYYKHSAFFQRQRVENLWTASDLQLYLDLYKYPLRGLEQAEYLYARRLKEKIEG
jgi:hypothetical protein